MRLIDSETLRHPALRLAAWLTWHSLEAKRHLYPLVPERVRRLLP